MSWMFSYAIAFDQNIGEWGTSQVTNFDGMFSGAASFNQDLSGWCVSQISQAPAEFDMEATLWEGGALTRPQWGTACD